MFLNKILVLTLAIMSLVAAKPGTMRNLKQQDTPKSPVKVLRVKGKDNPDEVDVTLNLQTCEKGSDECKKIIGDSEVKKGSKKKFGRVLADDMMGTLEEEDDDKGNRKLQNYVCDLYEWCDCCWCYYYYDCYYI